MANPYEIRSNLLKQAQDHLTQQYEANLKMSQDIMYATGEHLTQTSESLKKLMPVFPTVSEILAQAEKFQNFVNGK